MRNISKPIVKKDSASLVSGKPVYTSDIAPNDALAVKILRSPHAFAEIINIDASRAKKLSGVECVFTYEDVPKTRFTIAGQSYPETSPYDRLILDKYVRYVGDAAAIVAAKDAETAEKALKLIKVEYKVLEPVLDFKTALDSKTLVHPEADWQSVLDMGGDPKRNLCGTDGAKSGDVDSVLEKCDFTVDETYETKSCRQSMMESFRAFSYMDPFGKLTVVSSTQVPFHVRRILARALGIEKSKVRVIKPRIGGGFGAKQTAVCEMYPAFVSFVTGKPAVIEYTREECICCGSPRHQMRINVRVGADKEGNIKAMEIKTLSNTGAYGEHGWATVGLSGHKPLPIYPHVEAFNFDAKVVYTNTTPAGAYRGFGATQGFFAAESAVNELAHKMNMDPSALREKNMVKEGDVMEAYFGETAASCNLDKCLSKVKEMIDWDSKYPRKVMPDGKIRSVGLSLAMQGSGIAGIDVGSVRLALTDGGFYTLSVGATDMGTGCDTILAQIVSEVLCCDVDNISVNGVDTDTSPYDTGSYASATTYVTGKAAQMAAEKLRDKITAFGAELLGEKTAEFDGNFVFSGEKKVSLREISEKAINGSGEALEVTCGNSSPVSPPPFMAGAAEIELDPETGSVKVIDFAACVDCGTVINTNLARVQTEGGILQGIGMALFEDINYSKEGKMLNNSFMLYKIPSRLDVGEIRVEFAPSFEPTGPFGAKSIGEIVINTPSPAIADAVYNACGVRIRELPITPEKILMGILKNG